MPEAPRERIAPPLPEIVNAPALLAKTMPATLRLEASAGDVKVAVPNEAVLVVVSLAGTPPIQFPASVYAVPSPPPFQLIAICANA
jgi:hypothetical protein